MLDHHDADLAPRPLPAPAYEIVCGLTGDRAEADTAEAALVAAATLVDDDLEAHPIQGRLKALRDSLYVVENGTYAGILTAFAREGVRSL